MVWAIRLKLGSGLASGRCATRCKDPSREAIPLEAIPLQDPS